MCGLCAVARQGILPLPRCALLRPAHPSTPPKPSTQPFCRPSFANRSTSQKTKGVITNGTAVLGLGDIGPLAGKPVMEGKAVLFKKFADIDAFDIEIAERDPQKVCVW